MDRRIGVWLEDTIRSINEIENFLTEKRNFLAFQEDLKTKKAVERNIEIIGEAVNRISKQSLQEISIRHAHKIIGTRNRIAHDYDNISDEVIWTIVSRELPLLKEEAAALFEQYFGGHMNNQ